jgi:hypothetical protein
MLVLAQNHLEDKNAIWENDLRVKNGIRITPPSKLEY